MIIHLNYHQLKLDNVEKIKGCVDEWNRRFKDIIEIDVTRASE